MKTLCLALALCLSGVLCAQTATPPDAPSAQKTQEQKMRFSLLHSPPMSYAKDAAPLNPGQKFELFAINTVNPYTIVSAAASAGLSQALDDFHAYGQGAEGYGKRFGAAYADQASFNFFGTFLFPTILRQDPRYFRMEEGSFGSRTGYAISRIFVTRTDSRRTAPNVSLWMAAIAAGGLSNAYYPSHDQGAGLTFQRAGIAIGSQAGFNLLREFWPDIKRKVFKRR